MLSPDLTDLLGYAAAGLVLATFSAHSLRALRSLAIASNVAFIAYAAFAHLAPVLLLHALLLPLNVWRLREVLRADGARRQGAVASGKAPRLLRHRSFSGLALCCAPKTASVRRTHLPHGPAPARPWNGCSGATRRLLPRPMRQGRRRRVNPA